jgi:transposase
MEATGVYWKPVWHLLEGRFELVLANAQHIRNVPGRKTDVSDATWIADLLAHGLIRGSFVPPEPIQQLRDLMRTRRQLVREISQHSLRIQKVLEDANLKLGSVLSNVLGHSGRAMLAAIIAGEDDPERLAELAQGTARRKRSALVEALRGRVTPHHRAMLQLHLGLIDALDAALREIDDRVGKALEPIRASARLLTTIPGVGDLVANVIVAERHRHGSLPHQRPPHLLGGPLPTQRRERGQATLDPRPQKRPLAQDHARHRGLGGCPSA